MSIFAGSGANVITFASTLYNGPIRIRLGGGASTVDFSAVADFMGSATIDFGIGFGPKTYLAPGLVSGTVTLVNYP